MPGPRQLFSDRCPACDGATAWRSLFRMYHACPRCGFQFEREPGYFLAAMVFSWVLVNLSKQVSRG